MSVTPITPQELIDKGVISAPDVLTGTPAENKAIFDNMVANLVAPKLNEVIAVATEFASSETIRIENEEIRVANEDARILAEMARSDSETIRIAQETARQDSETTRITNEDTRQADELTRQSQEISRADAELVREENEAARMAHDAAWSVCEPYDNTRAYVVGNKVTYNGSTYVNTLPCVGVLPTDAAYWLVMAQRGVDGDGAGDMRATIYDPRGIEVDVYAYGDDRFATKDEAAQIADTVKSLEDRVAAIENMNDETCYLGRAVLGKFYLGAT